MMTADHPMAKMAMPRRGTGVDRRRKPESPVKGRRGPPSDAAHPELQPDARFRYHNPRSGWERNSPIH